jgi:hypothetical protein
MPKRILRAICLSLMKVFASFFKKKRFLAFVRRQAVLL